MRWGNKRLSGSTLNKLLCVCIDLLLLKTSKAKNRESQKILPTVHFKSQRKIIGDGQTSLRSVFAYSRGSCVGIFYIYLEQHNDRQSWLPPRCCRVQFIPLKGINIPSVLLNPLFPFPMLLIPSSRLLSGLLLILFLKERISDAADADGTGFLFEKDLPSRSLQTDPI